VCGNRNLFGRKRLTLMHGVSGWPPIERFSSFPSSLDGFGLTMSEDGGFDDVDEFFFAAANPGAPGLRHFRF